MLDVNQAGHSDRTLLRVLMCVFTTAVDVALVDRHPCLAAIDGQLTAS